MIEEASFRANTGIALEIKDLRQNFGRKKILQGGLNFMIQPGEFVGLLGPSGSGKSTLLKACCGLTKPSQGQVLYAQENLHKNQAKWRERLGYVPQDDIIHRELSVQKAIHYAARLRLPPDLKPETRDALVSRVIYEVGLEERRQVKIKRLSGGQRKRASVAVELLSRPDILFLDEPTSGQDPQLEEAMMGLFRSIARGGATVVVTTHAMASIEMLDLVILLQGGWLVYMGPPADLLTFFDSNSYEKVYKILGQDTPSEWHLRYQNSEFSKYLRQR